MKGSVDMPNRAPVLDSGPRIYVAVKSQDEETTMKMKRVLVNIHNDLRDKKQWYVKSIMIQSKYCSMKTHFGSYRGTECHFPRIKYCFCWCWWIFVRRVFHCIDIILWHFPPFSTHNVVISLPHLLCIQKSGLIPPSVNLRVSNLLLSFPHLQRDATLMR